MSDQLKSRTERRKAQQASQRRKRNPKKKSSILKKIFLVLFIATFAVLVGGASLFAFYASSSPKLDEELLRDPLSSEFLDVNGDVFLKTGTEKREYVPYDEIPSLMEDAVLATEDIRFYSHRGMDFYRLGGAVVANFRSGFGSQGGSTLTQQVIKNSFFKNDKTLKRKSQEAWLAFQLERKYDKEEIFEMYFNKILMSENQYGFGTGAKFFYGKTLDELELHEAAMLAGLPQSPNGYNPFNHPERAEKRRNIVLGLMHQHKKITKAEMEAAQAIDVTSTLLSEDEKKTTNNTKYPAFTNAVFHELEQEGLTDILSEGVTIQTTLDPKAQEAVEEALNSNIYANDEMQAGLTVLDTDTGAIVAIGGGRDYTAGFLNFAIQEARQPGSAIKPILSYAPAIEYLNWSTGQTINDEPYNYEGSKPPVPVRNVDRAYKGRITIREALYNSRNVPAVKIYEEVGRGKAVDFADRIGLPLKNEFPANALGGTDEFSTVELAGAYASFGNGGFYTKPHAIQKVTFRDGSSQNLKPDTTTAMKDSTAYMVTDMLRDVFTVGTGKRANVQGLDIAGKTGTTNFSDKEGAKDSWFVGYSTNYTIAAWGGYQDRKPMLNFEGERYVPQDLFRQVMSTISADKQTARFTKPSSVEEAVIVYGSEPLMLASNATPSNLKRTELFVKGELPSRVAKEEVTELKAPFDLSANYDADSNSITLSWSHEAPEKEQIEDDIEFVVQAKAGEGDMKEMTRTKDHTVTFSDSENTTYVFNVIAVAGDLSSSPASVTIQVGEQEDEENEEDEEENGEGDEEENKDDSSEDRDDEKDSNDENDRGQDEEKDNKEDDEGNREEQDESEHSTNNEEDDSSSKDNSSS